MIEFRDLTADDIEVRVQSVKQTGLVALLYKNARVDMAVLDDTVGAENWQREHYVCKDSLFCRVGINIGAINEKDDCWVWKSDCGTESNTEAQKGESSDSFKRACFNWGIGRELYTSPFIWIPFNDKDGKPQVKVENGKCYDKFYVGKIEIKDGKITKLVIGDRNTRRWVFAWQSEDCDA